MPGFESLGSIPMAVVAVAVLFLAAAFLGGWLVRPGHVGYHAGIDTQLLRLVIGLNLLGLLGALLGPCGFLADGRSVWLLAALIALAAGDLIWRRGKEIPRQVARWETTRSLARRIPVGFVILVFVTLGPALCYPTGWDELVYHSVLPQRWLADGRTAVYADLPYSGFPSLGEILFWLVAPVEMVIAPRLLSWLFWILSLSCFFRVLRRRLRPAAAAIVTLAVAVNDTELLISANCYVETLLLINVAGMLLVMAAPRRRCGAAAPRVRATLLGILAGGAAAVKLTGCAVLVVPCMWYVGEACLARSRWRGAIGNLVLSIAAAVSVSLPFYLRPWLATGNPFYPYFCQWFTQDAVRIEMSRYHHALGGFTFGVKSVAAFVDAPLLLAFRPQNYDGGFGLQLLFFVALAIVALAAVHRRRFRMAVLWPASTALWFYVFWFATSQQARFALPALLALVILASLGLRMLKRKWRPFVLASMLVAALISVPWWRIGYYWSSWLAIAGVLNRADYAHNVTDLVYMPLVQAVQALTPPDAKLMLLFEHRGFYLRRRYVIGTPLFQEGPFSPPERFRDVASVMHVFREGGITHVVMAKVTVGPDHAPGWYERQTPFLGAIEESVRGGRLKPICETEQHMLLVVTDATMSSTANKSTHPDGL